MVDDFGLAGPVRRKTAAPTLDDDGVPRDRWGRYVLPDPADTSRDHVYTRCTTLVKAIDDDYLLQLWKQRNVAFGLSRTPELLAEAAAADLADKKTLDRVCEDAMDRAGANTRRKVGSAIHKFCERQDLGLPGVPPPAWLAEVEAYTNLVDASGLHFPADYIEQTVICPEVDAAGRPDRIAVLWRDLVVSFPDGRTITLRKGETIIVDLKTGGSVEFGAGSIAGQLAVYSRATHRWLRDTRTLVDLPPVNQHVGLIIHVPVRDSADQPATAELRAVDLDHGWEAAKLAYALRAWRTSTKKSLMSEPLELHMSVESFIGQEAAAPAADEVAADARDGQKCINCGRPWKKGKITHERGCPESRRRSRKGTESPSVDSTPAATVPDRTDMVVRQLDLCPQCEAPVLVAGQLCSTCRTGNYARKTTAVPAANLCPQCEVPVTVGGQLCDECAEVQRGMLPDTDSCPQCEAQLRATGKLCDPCAAVLLGARQGTTPEWVETPPFALERPARPVLFSEALLSGDWRDAISLASGNPDLSKVFHAATAAGEWTNDLLNAGKQRQADGFK
jgi:hypothetical protein